MQYTNPFENNRGVEIIGDSENGCILPPSEYKKLKEDTTLLSALEQYIGASSEDILKALDIRSTQYFAPKDIKYFHGYAKFTTKNKGKERTGMKPYAKIRDIQKLLHRQLLHIPISSHITSGNAFQKGDGVSNAKQHINNQYTITLDVKKAFPSTDTHRVYKTLEGSIFNKLDIIAPLLSTHEQKQRFIGAVSHLLVRNNTLPEGAPTSPAVFDMVASTFHSELVKEASKYPIHNLKMTAYRDDITVSFQSHRTKVLQCIKEIKEIWDIKGKYGDQEIYKFIINSSSDLTSHATQSNEYKKIIAFLHDKEDTVIPGKEKTRTHLAAYIDSCIEKTKIKISSLYENIAVTNETDQNAIIKDIDTLICNMKSYIAYFDTEYGVQDYHQTAVESMCSRLLDKPLSYPQETIGDITAKLLKILQQQGYKVNMKKTRTQSPGSPFPINITGVDKMVDGRIMLPKSLMIQYSKVLTDLAKLTYDNLKKHPFYKHKFFSESVYDIINSDKVLEYIYGIMAYIKRIYGVTDFNNNEKIHSKLYQDYKECLQRWQRARYAKDLDETADQEYNTAYIKGNKQKEKDSNLTGENMFGGEESIDDLPF